MDVTRYREALKAILIICGTIFLTPVVIWIFCKELHFLFGE